MGGGNFIWCFLLAPKTYGNAKADLWIKSKKLQWRADSVTKSVAKEVVEYKIFREYGRVGQELSAKTTKRH